MEKLTIFDGNITAPDTYSIDGFELSVFSLRNPEIEDKNEDSLGVFVLDTETIVLAVADGAGGHPSGEKASKMAIEAIEDCLQQRDKELRSRILDGIEQANQSLLEGSPGSKTTLTICEISQNQARSYQVGDSGMIISGNKGKLIYRTVFHSPVGYGVEAGLINEREALKHPELNFISNLVGDPEMRIELGPLVSLQPLDTVCLASDGLFDNLTSLDLVELVRKDTTENAAIALAGHLTSMFYAKDSHEVKLDDACFILCRQKT
jgi:serine/threonine protein phosphatase PrpC